MLLPSGSAAYSLDPPRAFSDGLVGTRYPSGTLLCAINVPARTASAGHPNLLNDLASANPVEGRRAGHLPIRA